MNVSFDDPLPNDPLLRRLLVAANLVLASNSVLLGAGNFTWTNKKEDEAEPCWVCGRGLDRTEAYGDAA